MVEDVKEEDDHDDDADDSDDDDDDKEDGAQGFVFVLLFFPFLNCLVICAFVDLHLFVCCYFILVIDLAYLFFIYEIKRLALY